MKENMIMPLTKSLRSLKNFIIENGIKYILHLLYYIVVGILYLFGLNPPIYPGSEEHIETEHAESCNENQPKTNKLKQIKRQKYRLQKIRNKNWNLLKKLKNAQKNSDSSRNQSSNASNVTAINKSMNYKNIDSCIPYTASKKPINISTEEHSVNKTQFPINISQDIKSFADEQSNVIGNKFPKSYTSEQDSNSSANKEITQTFRQDLASSNNMRSSLKSFLCCKYKKSKQMNFYNRKKSRFSNNFPIRPQLKKNETEQKQELSIKFAPTNKKEKLTFDKEKNEKHTEQRNEKKTRKEKRSSRRNGPTKYKRHYSRIHVRNKESKQNNLKYKEMGTQTDSSFSTDDDVEMFSVGTKLIKKFYGCAIHKPQDMDMQQELNYVAHDEKLDSRLLTIELSSTYQLHSSYSPSSSSTDLSFDERTSATLHLDVAEGKWYTELLDSTNTFERPTRAPPGFPEVPQNPPLTSCNYNPECITLPSLKDDYDPNSHIKPVTVVPPAPPPMRHLYYNYPEFMELPTCSNSSNVLH